MWLTPCDVTSRPMNCIAPSPNRPSESITNGMKDELLAAQVSLYFAIFSRSRTAMGSTPPMLDAA